MGPIGPPYGRYRLSLAQEQVTLSGPEANWGTDQITVGFVQNAVSLSAKATYQTGVLVPEFSPPLPLLDYDSDEPPYYAVRYDRAADQYYIFRTTITTGVTTGKLHFSDMPNTLVPLEYPTRPRDKLTEFTEKLGFSLYIVAQTKDTSNNANKVFPALLQADWTISFRATFVAGNWKLLKTVTPANMRKGFWTILTSGLEPPVVSGPSFNSVFSDRVWVGSVN